jgi:hypothetical protein
MLDTPDVLYGEEQAASSYQGQDLFLSKHFVRSGNRKGKSDATSQDRLI